MTLFQLATKANQLQAELSALQLEISNALTSNVIIDTTGASNGQAFPNPFESLGIVFISSDPLWTMVVDDIQMIHLVGPLEETCSGIIIAIAGKLQTTQ